ncbi:hypothetical protein F1C16_09145 [Hymenobacter sp. NBH84]|uniref:hypothetical protein n=1 Tax=Hymenobacter sp. NBH84 TaxID=2596915 RepID=UPI0016260A31|nr:hypothetical protein [Hymenobacter sp. NBH84]QNE39707.1 hypothetical protein F1C16_09145 [Hymenobacter sp. NBH84]
MNFPKTASDVKHEILLSSDKSKEFGDLRIRQLIHILSEVEPEVIVEGVVQIFENGGRTDRYSQEQEFAGKILETINPKSCKDLKEVLLRVLKNWDKSVEQLPFWLRDNYGIGKLEETFAKLDLNEIEAGKLNTIRWWLHMNKTSA